MARLYSFQGNHYLMLQCSNFADICRDNELTFFTGVPDSTYKSWMSFLEEDHPEFTNVPTVNECEATAVAAGYHLATGKYPVIYMQNSGFGKTVNPLTSLCGPDIYRIPALLMIGWRGEPGKPEAHQHRQIGRIMTDLLDLLDVRHAILSEDTNEAREQVREAVNYMKTENLPYALVIRKGVFEPLEAKPKRESDLMSREEAIFAILEHITDEDILVSTTGKTSRELHEACQDLGRTAQNRFYNPGGMGCAPSIALGIALQKPTSKVFTMDGDGALLMQMGALATIGTQQPANFHHILFDNHAHESTGGQINNSGAVDFRSLAKSCGYKGALIVHSKDELSAVFPEFAKVDGPVMLVVKIRTGSRANLSRPEEPLEIKRKFMEHLERLS
ncbi:MAG: phosphonopyruvate decarboxylase [Candidatus Marinimicrobia bacterium]|nr:phosphonopyruvate decarboxylase [Candidatus Neomarinimicrobiota bacterium]MCF7829247.1 phosphonopyruvate decarboxylase [Candidatus Neomarinimicrobiota bacterium]MCF7881100.1 phosphonopyruvate decarboxylase [Candidatus Neomarinimicrobiota bacterium]